MLNLYIFISAP